MRTTPGARRRRARWILRAMWVVVFWAGIVALLVERSSRAREAVVRERVHDERAAGVAIEDPAGLLAAPRGE